MFRKYLSCFASYNRDRTKSATAVLSYPSVLSASIETKVLDDPRQYKVWGKELRRIILRSPDDAPVKGSYKITISVD